MNRFSFGSLRVRLILLVLVALIPSLILILHTGQEARRISGQNAKQDAMHLAVVASGNQDLLIESTRQLLEGLARRPELRQEDSKACSTLFADLLRRYKQYSNIIAVKPNGDLWCSGIPASGSPNYADRGWFPEVMRTRDFVIGEYVIGLVTKKPQSSIAYPIIDANGKVQKVIVTGFDLDWLNQFVAKTKLQPGTVLTVIDRNGTVLARTLEPDKWVGQTVKQAPVVSAILTKRDQGTLETTGIDGIKRLYAFAPLGTQTSGSVYVFIGIPTSAAYAQANRIVTRNLIALGLASLLAIIIAWVGSNLFLLRRIRTLLQTAKRLEDGDLSARAGMTYGTGELSKLAHAFNRMAESLEQRITERQRAEGLLREQLYFLQQLLDAIPVPIFYKDRQGMFRGCNRAYEKFVGMTKEQVIGKTVFGVAPQDLADIYLQADEALFTQPGTQVYETSFLHADGDRHEIIFNKATYVGTDGCVAGLVGFILDITERKRAEQEMAVLAEIGRVIGSTLDIETVYERFASITRKLIPFDTLSVNLIFAPQNLLHIAYISDLDLPGRTIGLDVPIAGTMTEYVMRSRKAMIFDASSAEEMIRQYPEITAIVSVQSGFHSNMLIPLFSNDAMIGVLHFRAKKQNAYSEADLRLAERIGMQIAGAVANSQLFSDLSKTEKSLRESNELFSLFMRHSPIYTYIKEVTPSRSLVLQASDNFQQMIGIPGGEMTGKTVMELFPPEFAAKITADDWAVVSRGDVLRLDEEFNGRSYTTIKFPIVRGDKTLLAGYTIDITERKRMEKERAGLEERLHRSEKMEALGQLAGGVAHDLNNILGILTGYSELLLEEIPDKSRSRMYVDKILQSTEKGAAIIQDLLTLARRGVTISDVTNLNSIVSGFLNTPVFEKIRDFHPQVTFRTACDKGLLNIKGSSVHLEKTLMNLVSNAAESISGEGEVTIRTESRYLDRAVRGYDEIKEGEYAVLVVSDTGMGIPAENREKIFEPFYTKKSMGRSGTGLGLAIVWGTVKDHKGYIDLQTEVGKGTTFTLYFPVSREEVIAQRQKVPIERYLGNGESVLVIDDVAEQRDVASRLLKRLEYKVHAVSSGEEAVEYLKENAADILVLDMIMAPGMDGLDTYQRALEINPKQKAILVSGFSATDRVREAQKLGAGAYVKKPYMMEKIGVVIRDELDRK